MRVFLCACGVTKRGTMHGMARETGNQPFAPLGLAKVILEVRITNRFLIAPSFCRMSEDATDCVHI